MKIFLPVTLLVCGAVILGGVAMAPGQDFVRTQPFQSQNYVNRAQPNVQRPTVSPYLGLLRRGGSSGIGLNYYSLVRPEIQTRDTLTRQQAEQDRLAQQTRQLQQEQKRPTIDPNTQAGANPITGASRTMRPTGHSTSLLNLGGRFMTR